MVVVGIPAQRPTGVILWQPLAVGAAQTGALMPRAWNRPDGTGTHEACADLVSDGRAIIGTC